MERRKFVETCAAISGSAGLAALPARAQAVPRRYDRARLVDVHRAPLKARVRAGPAPQAIDHGQGKARRPVGANAVVREFAQYRKQTIQC